MGLTVQVTVGAITCSIHDEEANTREAAETLVNLVSNTAQDLHERVLLFEAEITEPGEGAPSLTQEAVDAAVAILEAEGEDEG